MDVEPGQFWEFLGDPKAKAKDDYSLRGIEKGDLVIVLKLEDERIWIATSNGSTGFDAVYFANHFRYAPDGAERRKQEIDRLVRELTEAPPPDAVLDTLKDFKPHIEDGLLLEAAQPGAGGQARAAEPTRWENEEKATNDVDELRKEFRERLYPKNAIATTVKDRPSSIAQTKAKVNEFRVALKKYQANITEKRALLARRLEEQKALLDAKLAGMKEMIAHAEEAVWTLNLYLGKDEEVVRLKKGTPAPPEQRIVIRQLVLYMDEECAIAPEKGGIDFKNIETFDKWLLNPKHLEQVIPETKAVVALKVRRHDKNYGTKNAWEEALLNQANKVTYWLIRNGDNLYRIYTCLPVDDVIVPRQEEFDDLLTKSEYDWSTRDYKKTVLRPGSDGWMEAMDKFDARRRHYMRVLLFLQGLIDRTRIFAPMPVERINLMKERIHAEYVNYVYDGQENRLLPTGLVSFREWQKSVNAKLDVGHRIIGAFDSYNMWNIREEKRVHPKGASFPNSLTLYTIERKEGERLFFRYERVGDTVYPRSYYRSYYEKSHPPKRRASYWLEANDINALNFDLADAETMQFYLDDRVNRHDYINMFPVLKTAIALKEKEQKAEAPFRLLLTGEIMKAYDAKRSEAEGIVPDLVYWWKLKNKIHRALLSDDAKALRMIVAEYGRRRTQKGDHGGVVEAVQQQHPEVLLVAYKGKGEYVALIPENKENIFVRELLYTYSKHNDVFERVPTLRVKRDRRWVIVDTRLWSWTTLFENERMKAWPRDLRREYFLTDPEKQELVKEALSKAETAAKDSWRQLAKKNLSPIAVVIERNEIRVYMGRWVVHKPKHLLSKNFRDSSPLSGWFNFEWTRKRDVISIGSAQHWHESDRYWRDRGAPVMPFTNAVWVDKTALAKLDAADKQWDKILDECRRLERIVGQVAQQARAVMRQNIIAKARVAYIAEYGNDDLFDTENQNTRWDDKTPYAHSVQCAANFVVEQGIDVNGWTLERLFAEALKFGFESSEKDRDNGQVPFEMVIKLEADKDEDDDSAEIENEVEAS